MKQTLKRMLSVALAVFLLMPVLSIVINAYEEGTYDFNVPKAVAPITADGFINELEWKDALSLYFDDRTAFRQLVKQVMSVDFSWTVSAKKYIELYRSML